MPLALVMRRVGEVLVPMDELQAEKLLRLSPDKEVTVEVKQSRNPGHHRLLFALLNKVVENTEDFDDVKHLSRWIKIALGHVETMIGPDGKVYYMPKSISFAAMGQEKFNPFFNRALDLMVARYGFDRPALLAEIESITGLRWSSDIDRPPANELHPIEAG